MIEKRDISLVADSGYYRYLTLIYPSYKIFIVKTPKILYGTASACNNDNINITVLRKVVYAVYNFDGQFSP